MQLGLEERVQCILVFIRDLGQVRLSLVLCLPEHARWLWRCKLSS